jgi:hypothetical protein
MERFLHGHAQHFAKEFRGLLDAKPAPTAVQGRLGRKPAKSVTDRCR